MHGKTRAGQIDGGNARQSPQVRTTTSLPVRTTISLPVRTTISLE